MILFSLVFASIVALMIYAHFQSKKIRQEMFDEMLSDDNLGADEGFIVESSMNMESPTLPFPLSKELGIRPDSKLEMVYNHLIRTKKITKFDMRTMQITKASGYIYKLRGLGFTIVTRKDKEGHLECYELLSYKAK